MDGRLNNTFRVTRSHQFEPRSTTGIDFPFVDILQDGAVLTSFGTEIFSFGNLREVETWNITDEITYQHGIHNLTFGVNLETNHIKNGFMPQGSGHYVFNSWEDFTSGANPVFYSVTFSNAPGFEQVYPSFRFNQLSWYLQNEVRLTNNLNLTGGIRFDLPTYPEFPEALQTHPMIYELDFNGVNYNTAVMPKQRVMFSPRLGFNYDVLGDRSVVVRGGTGIFTGRIPFVWIVSQSGNAGMLQTTVDYRTSADIANFVGPFNPNIRAYFPTTPPVPGTMIPTGGFTIMDPEFKMPQTWKTSLAADFRLPFGFFGSIEGVLNRDINAVMVRNIGLVDPTPVNFAGLGPDRMMYPIGAARFIHRLDAEGQLSPTGSSGAQPLLITNVGDNGYYSSLTARLERNLWRGLSGMVAYTRSWSQSLHDGGGDQVLSLWRAYVTTHGSNTPELGYSSFVMPNNLIAALSYNYKGFTASLFYSGGNAGRASYTYSASVVRDGNTFNGINLIWVPNNPSEITFEEFTAGGVTYTPEMQSEAFFAFIEQCPYLRTRKGQYAEKNGLVLPWAHQFDIRFTQDFDFNVGNRSHRIQIGLDIMNFGNLLNSNWGHRWQTHQVQLLELRNANNMSETVAPQFHFRHISGTTNFPTETFREVVGAASTFRMQMSLRYIF